MRTTEDFRRRYHQAELLVLDGLDQLRDKPWAQEEFWHVLDVLAAEGATVVLAATDYPDSAFLPPLVERLQGGTVLPVLLPGPEVRRRFLKELASAFRLDLPEAALDNAARDLPVSVPKLYGAFAQMYVEASAQGVKADAAYLAAFLRTRSDSGKPGMEELAKRTARYFSLKLSDLRGKSRSKAVATARSVAVYLIRRQTRLSVQEIARYFGNRDPSTIRYLIERVRDELADDPALRDHLYRLEEGRGGRNTG